MLNDCLKPNLRLVICGTAAGKMSAARGQYYAGRGNKFWRTLFDIGLTPRKLSPAGYEQLPDFGIGLTDIVKGQAGMDSDINFQGSDREGLVQKIRQFQPRVLCFNGKKAAKVFLGRKSPEFGFQKESIGNTRLFVAPSTSGAANGYWDIIVWRELAEWIEKTEPLLVKV